MNAKINLMLFLVSRNKTPILSPQRAFYFAIKGCFHSPYKHSNDQLKRSYQAI
jgi:hypothetical protein